METIGDRIKYVMNIAAVNKTELAEILGISNAAVTKFCNGKNNPAPTTISLICREFGVNEQWLRTGEGEMFVKKTRNEEIAEALDKLITDDDEGNMFRTRLIVALAKLTPEQWRVAEQKAREILLGETDETPEQQARRESEEFFRERLAELKGEAKSSASQDSDANGGKKQA